MTQFRNRFTLAAVAAGVLVVAVTYFLIPVSEPALQPEVIAFVQEEGVLVAMDVSPSAPLVAASVSRGNVIKGRPAPSHFITVWDFRAGKEVARFEEEVQAGDVRFSPDGRLLASSSVNGYIRLRSTQPWAEHTAFNARLRLPGRLAFSPDGEMLAAGGCESDAVLYTLAPVAPVRRFGGHELAVDQVLFAPDGGCLVTIGARGPIHVWNRPGWERRLTLAGDPPKNEAVGFHGAAFAPDSGSFATAGAGRVVRIWGLAERAKRTSIPGVRLDPTALAYSPDGRHLVVGYSSSPQPGRVLVWDVQAGATVATYATRPNFVQSLRFADGGALLVVGTKDYFNSHIEVWRFRR